MSCSDSFLFKAKRAKHMGMNNEKISKAIGYKIKTPVESIKEFYRLYKSGYKEELLRFGGIS